MIFDTNVLIYLCKYILSPEKLLVQKTSISVITKIECLGFAFKNAEEHEMLKAICEKLDVIPLTDAIADETIKLRAKNRIKLPDAIIYATASVNKLPLMTNNIADFKTLGNGVELINPFEL